MKLKTLGQIIEWYENGQLKDAPSNHVEFDGNDLAKFYQQGIVDSKGGKQLITYR